MRTVSPLLSIIAITLFALSCSEEQPRLQHEWLDPTSPFNTLWDVRYCFNHFDLPLNIINDFSSLIADDFLFYFDPDDVGDYVGGYTIPAYWGRGEFIQVINNMFNQAYSIDFAIPILGQGEDAFGKPAEGDTTFSKSNVSISIIVMMDSTNGYMAQGFCDFRFIKGSDGLWRLDELRDHTAQLLCTSPTSLGYILALFY
jgi:hypothetical protein